MSSPKQQDARPNQHHSRPNATECSACAELLGESSRKENEEQANSVDDERCQNVCVHGSAPIALTSGHNQQDEARAKADSHANHEHRGVHAVAFFGLREETTESPKYLINGSMLLMVGLGRSPYTSFFGRWRSTPASAAICSHLLEPASFSLATSGSRIMLMSHYFPFAGSCQPVSGKQPCQTFGIGSSDMERLSFSPSTPNKITVSGDYFVTASHKRVDMLPVCGNTNTHRRNTEQTMGHADIQCLVTAAENAFLRVADAKQQLFEDAHAACRAEYISAFMNEPQRKIQTPGFGDKASERESVLADVFHGAFHGANGDADLHELIRIVGGVAQGRDMSMRASALIKKLAKDHADFHAEDL